MSNPPAWHPDPTGRHEHRYWDGEQWTEHVADAGRAATDPLNQGQGTPASAQTGAGTAQYAGTQASAPGATFPAAAPAPGQHAPTGSNTTAVLALILGILTLLTCWAPLMGVVAGRPVVAVIGVIVGVLAILAVVLGIKGRGVYRRTGTGSGMAVTGIITGILAVLGTLFFMGIALFFSSFAGDFNSLAECIEETGDEDACTRQFEESLLDRFGQ